MGVGLDPKATTLAELRVATLEAGGPDPSP